MSLDRFVEAQHAVYAQALAELRDGVKRSHWMWFIFPQIAGLGRSATAIHFAIRDADEARAYLAHPLLGARLIEATAATNDHAGRRTAAAILGEIDAIKLRSSMTLFEAVADAKTALPFTQCLDAFFAGNRDPATLDRL